MCTTRSTIFLCQEILSGKEASMSIEAVEYSVVLLGTMNPAIHHPSWYRLTGLCDANAMKLAEEDEQIALTRDFARFRTPDFEIACLRDTWTITSRQEDALSRIIEIALGTFDGKLPETPITAFGFNFKYQAKVQIPDVKGYLSECLGRIPIGLKGLGVTSAAFTSKKETDDRVLNIRIEPSINFPDAVFVALNFHHQLAVPEEPRHFKLEPLVVPQFDRACAEAQSLLDRITGALGQPLERGD